MKKTKSKKANNNISENISYKEATFSHTAQKLEIDNKPNETQLKNMKVVAEKVFQPLREWAGHPIKINSFFRCSDLNSAIGGAKSSQHLKGQAIDITTLGEKSNGELFEYIKENIKFDQLIWEFGNDKNPNWIHVSYVNPKSNRNRTLRAKKRGSQTTYFVI